MKTCLLDVKVLLALAWLDHAHRDLVQINSATVSKRLKDASNHADVTDAYLAGLAEAKRGILVTLDRKLADKNPDVTELICE